MVRALPGTRYVAGTLKERGKQQTSLVTMRAILPTKVIQLSTKAVRWTTNTYQVHTAAAAQNAKKNRQYNDNCCSREGGRTGRRSPCTILLPFFDRFFVPAPSARSFARALVGTPFQSVPVVPRHDDKMLLALGPYIMSYHAFFFVIIWLFTEASGYLVPHLIRF